MKDFFETLRIFIADYAAAYPLVTFLLLGLGPIVIAALSRNVVGLAIVACGAIFGFAIALMTGSFYQVLLGWWGILWLISLAFLLFGRPAPQLSPPRD